MAALAVFAVGCGSSGEVTSTTSTPAADASLPGGATGDGETLVAALGDSITSGSPGYDPDPAAARAYGFGQDPRSSYEYWAHQANPKITFRNCGVFGQETGQIATRLDDCANGADALIVQGGINDIAHSLRAGPKAALAAADGAAQNIAGMLDHAQEKGIPVAVTDVLPWNNGHPDADAAIVSLNKQIDALAKEHGIEALPFNATLADPKNPALMRRDWTADGDHPSVTGYRRLGELAFQLPK